MSNTITVELGLCFGCFGLVTKILDKLGLSCAKLRPAWASYHLAFVWLAFTEAAYYA